VTPLYIDKETRSPVDLKKAGLMRYAKHPLTEVLMMCWAFGDEDFVLWHQGQDLPDRVAAHVERGGIVIAHNAQFELALWNYVMRQRHDWPALRIEQVRCTMAASYAMGLPGALEDSGHALGLKITKDTEGRALMLKMCKPKREVKAARDATIAWNAGEVAVWHDGVWYFYHDTPEMRARLGAYCITDGQSEREIYKRVLPLSDQEQRLWQLDQRINLRGIPFDMPSLEAALKVADTEKERLNDEMARVTEGKVTACSAVAALKDWAADFGVIRDSIAKAELNELLGEEYLPEPVEEALKLRLSAGRFTSISKLNAIKRREMGWRVAYALQYHAATTGRWAGRGIQPHNFTRDLPEPHEVEDVLSSLRRGDARWIDLAYGEPSIMISKCLRGFMHAAPGKTLLGGDFSSIEGRGLAWLAGEEWKLTAYREIDANPELPDMYERTYAVTFGIRPEDVTKLQRQIGKVEDLAFGYAGGVGAFRTMAKAGNILVVREVTEAVARKAKKLGLQVFTEIQVDGFKRGWRDGNPKIKAYWYALEKAARAAVAQPGVITHAGARGREVSFRKRGSFLWCRLPSGRTLCYPYPEIRTGDFGEFVSFKGSPDPTVWAIYSNWLLFGKKAGLSNPTYIVEDDGNTRQWCRMSTYGGKLSENVTQAICRDILAEAMLRVEAASFPVVVHVHDEVITEGAFNEADRVRFEALMTEVPVWAKDFPISAGCWLSPRYIKG
jgi:DNA polymerase bacteriophage-type